MGRGFWIAGTDTNAGKTVITAYFMRCFQEQGKNTVPYKPVQTGLVTDESGSWYPDTAFYRKFSLTDLKVDHINTYSFKTPASPHYAAALEQAEIRKDVILKQMTTLQSVYDVVICEGAGGLYVPLNAEQEYCLIDLIEESQLPVVLVARTTLGTINHTLLSLDVLRSRGILTAGIVFNRFTGTEMETDNIKTIHRLTGLPYLIFPELGDVSEIKSLILGNHTFLRQLIGS